MPQLDVQQTLASGTAVDLGSGHRAFIWKPAYSGKLSRIDIEAYFYVDSTGDIVVELWSASARLPVAKIADLGKIIRTQQYGPQNYTFRPLAVCNPPTVVAGTEYAIVFYCNGNHIAQHWPNNQTSITYGGECYYNGSVWVNCGGGISNRIYVDSVADQVNNNGQGINLGVGQYLGVQFLPNNSGVLTDVETYIYNLSGTSAIHYEIWSDDGNDEPLAMLADYGTVPVNTAAYDARKATPASPISVTAGTKYWLIAYPVTGSNIAILNLYGGAGTRARGAYSTNKTAWYPQLPPFKTYIDQEDAVALVTHASASSSNGDATTAALDTTGATLLVVSSHYYFGNSTTPTISDSKGNTWTPLTVYTQGNYKVCLFYVVNPTVGSGHTFTSNQDQFHDIAVAAFSGIDTVSPFDKELGSNGSAVSTLQPGSVTPTNQASLVISAATFSGTTIPSVSSDMTIIEAVNSPMVGGLAYQIQTVIAAENPTWSSNAGGASVAAAIAVFKRSVPTPSWTRVAQAGTGTLGNNFGTGSTIAVSPGNNSLLVVATCIRGTSLAGASVSGGGLTWNTIGESTDGGHSVVKMWWAWNPTAQSFNVSVSWGGGAQGSSIYAEYTGIDSSGLDTYATASDPTYAPPYNWNIPLPPRNYDAELAVGYAIGYYVGDYSSWDAGFDNTKVFLWNDPTGGVASMMVERNCPLASNRYYIRGNQGDSYAAYIGATFKVAAGGAPPNYIITEEFQLR